MTDPEKIELLSELWREPGVGDPMRESALGGMIAEGRRRRSRRRFAQVSLLAAAVIVGALCLWPRRDNSKPQFSTPAVSQAAAPSRAIVTIEDREPPQLVEVHHLTPAETEERLGRLKGYAYARVGAPGERRMVLLEKIEK